MAATFQTYAPYYDLLYRDKDYPGEAAFIGRLLQAHLGAVHPPELRVLDLACGTGRHSRELAQLGYHMAGSDLSADMIEVARAVAAEQKLAIAYHTERFQTCARIGQPFDAVIAMFAAIDYLIDAADLTLALNNIKSLVRPGGVFIFDFWNGNAVISDYSPRRVKSVEENDLRMVRTSNTTLDTMTQRATVRFDFELSKDGALIDQFSETHVVRYFYPQEMADLLLAHGFEVIQRCPFMNESRPPAASDWNLTYVVRPTHRTASP